MKIFNIHEAKAHFSKIITQVKTGEEIIIAKAGKPVAKLIPIREKPKSRIPGTAKGKITLTEGFESPLPEEVVQEFEKEM
ncbi:MAG: type II toxin-antitoxin system Phd/YefM family antitoxin [Desulfurellaceae bacterium]|nr:type II toxin-antitoxin system Phd/YefM family antitoxin [Desulfurellaceae bacterium]